MFDLRLMAAMIDGAWSQRRPGLMALLLVDLMAVAGNLQLLTRGDVPQVLPSEGLVTAQEVANLSGLGLRAVQKAGLPVRALRKSRRGGRAAHLYAVDDVIPWLLERAGS